MTLAKVVKIKSKIIISLPWSKSVKQTVGIESFIRGSEMEFTKVRLKDLTRLIWITAWSEVQKCGFTINGTQYITIGQNVRMKLIYIFCEWNLPWWSYVENTLNLSLNEKSNFWPFFCFDLKLFDLATQNHLISPFLCEN